MPTQVPAITDDRVATGGFTPETELLTTRGPIRVDELSVGDRVYALNESARLAKPKFVKRIDRGPATEPLIEITGRRVNLRLHPTHRVLFATRGRPQPRFRQAGDLTQQEYYRFVNEWETPSGARVETVDITEFVDEYEARATTDDHGHTFRAALPDGCEPSYVNSHSGYHFDPTMFKRYQSDIESVADEVSVRRGRKRRTKPYLFAGDDFIEFLGWFITEGNVYRPPDRQTAEVKIAQETPTHHRRIAGLCDRMNLNPTVDERGFRFSSEVIGELLESLCGSSSHTKRLPSFVWRLATTQQRLLMETLVRGDGNERGMYFTASENLTADVLRLSVEVGMKPGYSRREDIWRVYTTKGQGGFRSSTNVSTVDVETSLYRVVVEDYGSVMAGRNGRFQWVGASGVV